MKPKTQIPPVSLTIRGTSGIVNLETGWLGNMNSCEELCPPISDRLTITPQVGPMPDIFQTLSGHKTRLDRANYPSAIVFTALGLEAKAVRSHLSQINPFAGKTIVYECGLFSSGSVTWFVAVAEIGTGNPNATSFVHLALKDFREIDVIMFVGIAAGLKEELKLGDVIASTKVYGYHCGKADSEFESRPTLQMPDIRLEQAARYIARNDQWIQRIINAPRPSKNPAYEYPPCAHVAPLASGEQVVSSRKSETYRLIKQHFGDAYAVEMEGYGALQATNLERIPSIVIRGISDCIDDKFAEHDRLMQPVAAAHASAFAFEMLSQIGHLRLFPTSDVPPQENHHPEKLSDAKIIDNLKRTLLVIKLDVNSDQINKKVLEESIKRQVNDPALIIIKIEQGSSILFLDLSEFAANRLLNEFKNGTLEIGGFEVVFISSYQEYNTLKEIRERLRFASAELCNWPKSLPSGQWIKRGELIQIVNNIITEPSSTIILLGEPGSGKSSLLSKLTDNLNNMKIPFLGIKADSLIPISSFEDLGKSIGLPGDPIFCLNHLSHFGPVVLLVDQLDALSSLVDLHTERLNVLLSLIRELSSQKNIHIIASCRTFEFNHDVRLCNLQAEPITLEKPPWREISNVLNENNVENVDNFPHKFQDLLRVPQFLKIFTNLYSRMENISLFDSYSAMLDKLWEKYVLSGEGSTGKITLLTEIALSMAEKETLWLPMAAFDNYNFDINQLEAAGILIRSNDEQRIGFSHQTIFEHALARAFAKEERKFSSYVLERQNGLFIRPKLLAILFYLRSVNKPTYEKELELLWKTSKLRFFLRLLLIDFLGQHNDPSEKEASLLLPFLNESDFRKRILRAISKSSGWFDMLVSSYLPGIMESDSQIASEALPVLLNAWSFSPDKVRELIEEYWIEDKNKDSLSWYCYEHAIDWDSRDIKNIQKIIYRNDFGRGQANFLARKVSTKEPNLAPLIIAEALKKSISVIKINKQSNINSGYGKLLEADNEWYDVQAISEAAPESYIASCWPYYIEIFEETRASERDDITCYRAFNSYALRLRSDYEGDIISPLMDAIVIAIKGYAIQDHEKFLQWVTNYYQSDLLIVHRLISIGLMQVVENTPDIVFNYLIGDKRRLSIGGWEDPQSETIELIKTVLNHNDKGKVATLEKYILEYNYLDPYLKGLTPQEKQSRRKSNRFYRLKLLDNFPSNLLSESTRQLILVEKRRFPNLYRRDKRIIGPGIVGSPMSQEQMARANDADILKIFKKLDDNTNWDYPGHFMKGGSIQLSREFAEFAKKNSERAIQLMQKFMAGHQERPAAYAIEALSEIDYNVDKLIDLILLLDKKGFRSDEFQQRIAWTIGKILPKKAQIPEQIIEILIRWLEEPREPAIAERKSNEQDTQKEESILWGYHRFAILPHGNYPILETLTKIFLMREPPAADLWLNLLEQHLQRSDNIEVWRAISRYMKYLSLCGKEHANAFLSELLEKYHELLFTDDGIFLIAHTYQWIDETILQKWLNNLRLGEVKRYKQAYGELIVLIAVSAPERQWAIKQVLSIIKQKDTYFTNDESILIGMAYAAAYLWHDKKHKAFAGNILTELMSIKHDSLDKAIMTIFNNAKGFKPDEETENILKALLVNERLIGHYGTEYLVERLRELIPYEIDFVYQISMATINRLGNLLGDFSTRFALLLLNSSNIALTLHRIGGDRREQGLAMFEKLLTFDAYEAKKILDELDGITFDNREGVSLHRRRRRSHKTEA